MNGYSLIGSTKEKSKKMVLKEKVSYQTLSICFTKWYSVMRKDSTNLHFQKWSNSVSALSKVVTCEIFTEIFYHLDTVYSKTLARKQINMQEKAKMFFGHCFFSKKGTIPKVVCFPFASSFSLVVVKESSGEDKLLLDGHKPPIHSRFRIPRNTNLTSRSE